MNDARTSIRLPGLLVWGGATACFGLGLMLARTPVTSDTKPPREPPVVPPLAAALEGEPGSSLIDFGETPELIEAPVQLSWNERWEESSAFPISPASTRARADLLEKLARTDPGLALELALAEVNLLVREQLRAGALRGWAAVAPDEALQWATSQTVTGERMRCITAVLTGAAEHPEAAVRIAQLAFATDPQLAGDYGHHLINALVDRAGNFEEAARLAVDATTVDRQSFLVDSAYYQWAQHDPQRAFAELASLTDPVAYDAAMKGVIEGAADADARRLADFAMTLPEGDDRSWMLAVALPEWVGKAPKEALSWIRDADPHPDFDLGIAAIASRTGLVESQPRAAMELTDGICDAVRRSLAKSDVLLQWARSDFAAAQQYALSVQNPEYREMFLVDLESVAAGMLGE